MTLTARDRAQVDRLYALASAHGSTNESPRGERFPGFYAAYFPDRDENKPNTYVMEQN